MARTIVALYDDFNSANNAVKELVDNGIRRDFISLMASDQKGEYQKNLRTGETSSTATGADVGAGIGAAIGGLGGILIGLGALTIPVIGPVIAAGPLAAALGGLVGAGAGAVAGGVTGGLIGALMDAGVPEEHAQYYAEGVKRGGTLLTVRADDFNVEEKALRIINKYNPIDVNQRVEQWRQAGWTRFETGQVPVTGTDPNMGRMDPSGRVDSPSGRVDTPSGQFQSTTDYDRDRDYPTTESTGHMTDRTDVGSGYRSSEDMTSMGDFDMYSNRFRTHYTTSLSGSGYTYDQYMPAYRYGYEMAREDRYRNRNWEDIEPELRTSWHNRYPDSDWERFKGAIHHAWLEVRSALR